jgi:molybdopterin synthase sulfur carrier subunit
MPDVRVVLPQHLQALARLPDREVILAVTGDVSVRSIIDAVEARFPQLCGTIRDHGTAPGRPGKRRPFVRFFACAEDFSHAAPDDPLPAAVAEGREPFLVVGAMAGG